MMNATSDIGVRGVKPARDAELNDLVLGEDWVQPQSEVAAEVRERRRRRGFISINRSPLARKIITFNLMAMLMLVAGVLYLNPVRDNLVLQRETGLVSEAHLIADVFEAQLPDTAPADLAAGDGIDVVETLAGLRLSPGIETYVFAPDGTLLGSTVGLDRSGATPLRPPVTPGSTILTDSLSKGWEALSGLFNAKDAAVSDVNIEETLRGMIAGAMTGETWVDSEIYRDGGTIFSVVTPIVQNGATVGVVALSLSLIHI